MAEFAMPVDEGLILVDDGKFAGVEVTVNLNVGMGTVLDLQRLRHKPDGETPEELAERVAALLQLLDDDGLIRWNITTRRGKPIPCDLSGLRRIDPELVGILISEWHGALISPNPRRPSQPGEPAAE